MGGGEEEKRKRENGKEDMRRRGRSVKRKDGQCQCRLSSFTVEIGIEIGIGIKMLFALLLHAMIQTELSTLS